MCVCVNGCFVSTYPSDLKPLLYMLCMVRIMVQKYVVSKYFIIGSNFYTSVVVYLHVCILFSIVLDFTLPFGRTAAIEW